MKPEFFLPFPNRDKRFLLHPSLTRYDAQAVPINDAARELVKQKGCVPYVWCCVTESLLFNAPVAALALAHHGMRVHLNALIEQEQ